ncbi:hypothetical protein T4E_7292 [Trichinella pseudospiralis]|uniref:Uncharacterized protein n=1 Tax=Trichinella pseudospiralis TaxID=6337 RepID=A0A0V0Y0C0_TRIPS|nr:hypothetical protein T4E_7292 [Trichinella pseudospiralis]
MEMKHDLNLKSLWISNWVCFILKCLKKKGAAESETGSSVLFGSVKGLRDSTDSADGTFGSWQLKCTFGCCWCCHWPEMEWKKLHQIEENIKQISEHKQLTTLDNVDCRISNVSSNNARIQKAIDNLKSINEEKDLFVLESQRVVLHFCFLNNRTASIAICDSREYCLFRCLFTLFLLALLRGKAIFIDSQLAENVRLSPADRT